MNDTNAHTGNQESLQNNQSTRPRRTGKEIPQNNSSPKQKKTKNVKQNSSLLPPLELRAHENIQIPYKFRLYLLENDVIQELFDNMEQLNHYLDVMPALQKQNYEFELKTNEKIKVFDSRFHEKKTGENVYFVAKTADKSYRRFKWKLEKRMYTAEDLKNEWEMTQKEIPQINIPQFESKLLRIQKCIGKKQIFSRRINNIKWNKVPIHREQNKKMMCCLEMSQPELRNIILTFVEDHGSQYKKLIPILIFKDGKPCVEFILMVTFVHNDLKFCMGIVLDFHMGSLVAMSIYLNKHSILRQHKLVSPSNDYHCMDEFKEFGCANDLIIYSSYVGEKHTNAEQKYDECRQDASALNFIPTESFAQYCIEPLNKSSENLVQLQLQQKGVSKCLCIVPMNQVSYFKNMLSKNTNNTNESVNI